VILLVVSLLALAVVSYWKFVLQSKLPTSTQTKTSTNNAVETANWKTYSTEKEGISYSFKYPPSFRLYPNFKPDDLKNFDIVPYDYVSNKDINENSGEGTITIKIGIGNYYSDETYSDSKLGNIPSKRLETHGSPVHGCCDTTLIYYKSEFLNGKDTLEVDCLFAPVGDKKLRDTCEKIVATFNVKADITLKWELYTNEKYHYSLKQPEVLTNAYEDATGVSPEDNGYKTTSKVFVENAQGDHLLTLTVFPNTQPTELVNKTKKEFNIADSDISKLQLSGVSAITFKKDGLKYIELVKDGNQFEFAILTKGESPLKSALSNEELGDDIISTFKFLD